MIALYDRSKGDNGIKKKLVQKRLEGVLLEEQKRHSFQGVMTTRIHRSKAIFVTIIAIITSIATTSAPATTTRHHPHHHGERWAWEPSEGRTTLTVGLASWVTWHSSSMACDIFTFPSRRYHGPQNDSKPKRPITCPGSKHGDSEGDSRSGCMCMRLPLTSASVPLIGQRVAP